MESEDNPLLKKTFNKIKSKANKTSDLVVLLYEYVQSFPYRVSKFISALDLIKNGYGDCRHKSALLYELYKLIPLKVRKVKVTFDWKDLPIPKEILKILKKSKTVWSHDTLQIKIDNKWITVDPTWDPELKKAGFPVTSQWDGKSDTLMVTNSKIEIITDIKRRSHTKIDHNEALKFAEALNNYLDRVRKCLYTAYAYIKIR